MQTKIKKIQQKIIEKLKIKKLFKININNKDN